MGDICEQYVYHSIKKMSNKGLMCTRSSDFIDLKFPFKCSSNIHRNRAEVSECNTENCLKKFQTV